jgi:hypothetical protein
LGNNRNYPKTGTSSAKGYYYSDLEIGNFLNWVSFMAGRIDKMRRIANEAIGKDPGDDLMLIELRKNRLILMQMVITRMVDNFLTYLSEVLFKSFRIKPEAMRSSEKIELIEVLQYDNFEGIVAHIAEKKVHSLSYQSIIDLDNYFSDKFGVNIVDGEDREFLIEVVETRNLIIHNRGIKNKIYVQKCGGDKSQIGEIRDIEIDYVRSANTLFNESVKRLDRNLRRKLGVSGHRFDVVASFINRA